VADTYTEFKHIKHKMLLVYDANFIYQMIFFSSLQNLCYISWTTNEKWTGKCLQFVFNTKKREVV